MKTRPTKILLITAAFAMGGFSPSAFAYLDPSTGSMILSAIVGILATAGLALKTYWYKLKTLFKGQKVKGQKATQSESPATESAPAVNSEAD
jgi:hypothetical protein